MLKLAVDVGGTFTDICVLDADSGRVWIEKVPSTPGDQSLGFIDGILAGLRKAGAAPGNVEFLVHGTTVATNALLEHKGAKTALLTTEGFRDVLEIGTQQRAELYSVVQSRQPSLVPRYLRRDVPERVAFDGGVVTPLDESEARAALEDLAAEGVESIAICLLFSFMNESHERRLAELAAEIMPNVMISLSSSLSPEYREFWRMSTTTINAYVMPPVFKYIDRLEDRLREEGVKAGLHVMQSTGGLMTATSTKERPVNTILSGPVGGVVGGTFFGVSAGFGDLVTFDMGGTSCDVATVVRGEPGRSHLKNVEGYPLRTPMIDIETIGAGGGSIAHVDAAGGLKVGPESASAVPGPACYQRGGTRATVSDANLAVGILGSDTILGRDLKLDAEAARTAVERDVAQPLGLTVEDAAAGIIEIANANMLGAIRLITVEKGLDPRTFSLVAFGGAGPMHACGVARQAAIPYVIVPPHPGITSAVGCLMTDIRHPMAAPFIVPTEKADLIEAEAIFERLRREAERKLLEDGVPPEAISFRRYADMRYHGQAYELTIPCDEPLAGPGADNPERAVERFITSFHAAHEQAYGHHSEEEPTQFVNLRVEGVGTVPRGAWSEQIAPRYEHDRRRSVYVKGQGWLEAPVIDRSRLAEGESYPGPMVVEQHDTTTWIPPGDVATIDAHGNIIVEVVQLTARSRESSLDPITREVVANSLTSAAKEMSRAMRRSAYSAIIYDMLDYSCAMFGPGGELISQDENLPAQLGVMSSAISHMLRKFPPKQMHPGDVFIMNHPYFGATHSNDLIVFTPMYHGERLMGYAGTNAHHMDVGGKTPATEAADATEVWQEGLLLPIVRLYDAGEPNQALLDVLAANVRIPRETLGDVRSQIAACRTGERRWVELCERYGADDLMRYVEGLWSHAEAIMRQQIGAMNQGTYTAEGFMDPDLYSDEPVHVVVTVTVGDGRIHADFTGTDTQVRGSMNCPLSSTVSAIWYAVRCMIDLDVEMNEGCYRPVSWTVPEGSILNPRPPAAVSVRHPTSLKVADVMLKALCQAKPERSSAGCSVSFPTFNATGIDPRSGQPYLCADIVGGGMGGHDNGDGLSAIDTHLGNCAMMFAEALELEAPLRVLKTELVPDSGGAGVHRGGLAVQRWYEVIAPEVTIAGWYGDQTTEGSRPWGFAGGSPGREAAITSNPGCEDERRLRARGVHLEKRLGERMALSGAGGGGWGRPQDRDAEALAWDIRNDYVTVEGARRDYGDDLAEAALKRVADLREA